MRRKEFLLLSLLALGCRDRGALSPRLQPPVEITTSGLPDAVVGQPYIFTLQATGGDGNYVWGLSVGALPDGLTLDSNTGVISGIPTEVSQSGLMQVFNP